MTIKEQLEKGNIEFTINGITGYLKGEDGEWGMNLERFKVSDNAGSIYTLLGSGMNVTKWGPTCVTLYTYDMLGNRSTGKIRYQDVTIVEKVNLPFNTSFVRTR